MTSSSHLHQAMSKQHVRATHKAVLRMMQDNIYQSLKDDYKVIRPDHEVNLKLEEMLKYSKGGSGR